MTGLYLHIPFCGKKCFYCSFVVAVDQKHHADEYVRCLEREMHLYDGAKIGSVYFGGGTPSVLSEEQFVFLASCIKKIFTVEDGAEWTVEINPEDVTAAKLRCYQDAGVTRVSLGMQTFDERYLKMLGRSHSAECVQEAYRAMRGQGFDHVSVDLMYGFPGQTREDIFQDLKVIRALSSDHVSLYTLTIEEGSRFFRDKVVLPDAQVMAEYYVFVRDEITTMGFEHYEVSNFAKPGRRSAHNMNYWQGGNYIGLGVAAHSHQDGCRWWNVDRLRIYIEKMQHEGFAKLGEERLSCQQRLGETLVFGLRMLDGVDLNTLEEKFGKLSCDQKRNIERFVADGMLEWDHGRLRTTPAGMLFLDEISPRLI